MIARLPRKNTEKERMFGDILKASAKSYFHEASSILKEEPTAVLAVDVFSGFSPLHFAACNADRRMVALFIKYNAPPFTEDGKGRIPLQLLPKRIDPELFELLEAYTFQGFDGLFDGSSDAQQQSGASGLRLVKK